jgi:hypothetical protein
MAKTDKSTSQDVASNAAKLLSSTRTPERVRSVAGSALSQTKPTRPKKAKAAKSRVRSFKAGKDL